MWTAFLSDSNKEFFLRGPICKVGRALDNCLSFPSDKSVSRCHAEIHIKDGELFLTDKTSKFGTCILGARERKLSSEIEEKIVSGETVLFGTLGSRILFVFQKLAFCVTRLEKVDKERLKRNAKTIGAIIVNRAEDATHVVSNKFAATIKMLTAIVLKKQIITGEWLSFAETDRPREEILPAREFAPFSPNLDDQNFRLADLDKSRDALLRDYVIFILDEADVQYDVVLRGCGADVRYLHDTTGHAAVVCRIKDMARKDSFRTACFFHDESRGPPKELYTSGELGLSVFWLSAGQLASSIINFLEPVLSPDVPSQRSALSQRLSQILPTQSQVAEGAPQPPNNVAHTNRPTSVATGQTSYLLPSKPCPAKVVLSFPTAQSPKEKEQEKELNVRGKSANPADVHPLPTNQHSRETVTPPEVPMNRSKRDRATTKEIANTKGDDDNDDWSQPLKKVKALRARPVTEPLKPDASKICPVDIPVAVQVPVVSPISLSPNRSSYDDLASPFPLQLADVDGSWYPIVPRDQRTAIAAANRRHREASEPSNGGDSAPPEQCQSQGETIEKMFALRGPDNESRNSKSQTGSHIPNDKRKFRKNSVQIVEIDEIMSSKTMEKVLPKESEREIQLRLEIEGEEERAAVAEEMFADRLVFN